MGPYNFFLALSFLNQKAAFLRAGASFFNSRSPPVPLLLHDVAQRLDHVASLIKDAASDWPHNHTVSLETGARWSNCRAVSLRRDVDGARLFANDRHSTRVKAAV